MDRKRAISFIVCILTTGLLVCCLYPSSDKSIFFLLGFLWGVVKWEICQRD